MNVVLVPMAFTQDEQEWILDTLERCFWSKRRPPLRVRDRMWEGQRIEGHSLELFFVRPVFDQPDQTVEEAVAKLTLVRTWSVWKIFWKRADGKWHGYPPCPEADSLEEALQVVDADSHGCFFG